MLSKNRAEKTASAALKSGSYVLFFKKERNCCTLALKKNHLFIAISLKKSFKDSSNGQVVLLKLFKASKSFCFHMRSYFTVSFTAELVSEKPFVVLFTEPCVQSSTKDWELQH